MKMPHFLLFAVFLPFSLNACQPSEQEVVVEQLRDNRGASPLSEAINHGHAAAARILIAAGTDTTGLDISRVENW